MKTARLILSSFLVCAAFAVRAGHQTGTRLSFFRNVYSGSIDQIDALDRDNVKPDLYVVLPGAVVANPWNVKNEEVLSLFCGGIMRGFLCPDRDGEFLFIVPENSTKCRLFLSPDTSEEHAKEIVLSHSDHYSSVSWRKSKKKDEGYERVVVPGLVQAAPIPLKQGHRYFFKLQFVSSGETTRLDWANAAAGKKGAKGLDDGEDLEIEDGTDMGVDVSLNPTAMREVIAAKCLPLIPAKSYGGEADVLHLPVPEATVEDDEPDSLSWELFTKEPVIIRHFFDWARKNPPPADVKPAVAESVPEKVPYARYAAAELALDGSPRWHPGKEDGVRVLVGPGSHNFQDKTQAVVEIPADGEYRLWTCYRHKQGSNESFSLKVKRVEGENAKDDPIEDFFPCFEQVFARSNAHPGRPTDPVTEISSVPTPEDGYLWEGSHRTARLRKGKYTLFFGGGQFPNRPQLAIRDIMFIADPMYAPKDASDAPPVGAGETAASPLSRDPLYAYRPGAGRATASLALRTWWNAWRETLFAKLAEQNVGDYDWSYLRTLNVFDETINAVGRADELAALRRTAEGPRETHVAEGTEIGGDRDGDAEVEFEIAKAGRYNLWTQLEYEGRQWRALRPLNVTVTSGGRTVREFSAGWDYQQKNCEGRRSKWDRSGWMELPSGKVKVSFRVTDEEKAPKEKARTVPRHLLKVLLTAAIDYNPAREIFAPDGRKVGKEDLGYWRAPIPWTHLAPYSPPGEFMGKDGWKLLPEAELNRAEHEVGVKRGEVVSELFMVRNNTEKPVSFEPKVTAEIPVRVRVVSYILPANGVWSPMLLMNRRRVTAPAGQNLGLWLTLDARNAVDGRTYPVKLEFAGRTVTWNVKVEGSMDGVPEPWMYPYAGPYPRESSWEAFKDVGFNMIRFNRVPKRYLEKYGVRMLVGMPGAHVGVSVQEVRDLIASAAKLGLEPEDYCWYLIDEPGPESIPTWMDMAKTIKAAEPRCKLWCNLGFFAPAAKWWDVYFPFMDMWDIGCPFRFHFTEKPEVAGYVKKLGELKGVKLIYDTLDIGSNEKRLDAPQDQINIAKLAIRWKRDGWAVFSFCFGSPWDNAYEGNQDTAVSIYPAAYGRTIMTRNTEAAREGMRLWRRARQEGK